jgi:hypothetical protein
MGRWRLAAGLGAILAVALCDPSHAAWPGASGPIVFDPGWSGTSDIWRMNPDGSRQRMLLGGGESTQNPAVSPDGQRIVYEVIDETTTEFQERDLFLMNIDGTGRVPLLLNDSNDVGPSFSPDGQRVIFTRGSNLYSVNVDGTGETLVAGGHDPDADPPDFREVMQAVYSPDGSQIAYTGHGGPNFSIYVMNADGTGRRRLTTENDHHASWSPDGERIVFERQPALNNVEVYVMNADGSGVRQLTDRVGFDTQPVFSPDGRRIAFASDSRGGVTEILTINPDGSDERVLTDSRASSMMGLANAGTPDWGPGEVEPPVAMETVNVAPVKGTVTAKCRGDRRFEPVEVLQSVPVGCQIDTRRGTVRLTAAAVSGPSAAGVGRLATGEFRAGIFSVIQSRGARPVTELRLTEQLTCPRGRARSARARSRRLWGNGTGRFRTRGRNSTASVRGTEWYTKDTCSATITEVREGVVVVRDFTKGRNVRLTAGERYVARDRRK